MLAWCCVGMQMYASAQKVKSETDSVEIYYYQKAGYLTYNENASKSTVVGATREGYRSKFVTTSEIKSRNGYIIPALTKYLNAEELNGYFSPEEVKVNIPAGKMAYRRFNSANDYKMGRVLYSRENKDSLVFSSNNLLENAYGYFLDFGILDTTEVFFRDQRKQFGVVMTVHRMSIDEMTKSGYITTEAYVTIELRDVYDVKLFEKEFEIKGNVMPLSFLDDRFFMNYWQSVVEGSAGTRIWNDILEEAYLQFFYTPELAMILEEWGAKCNEPVSDAELTISKATLTKASPGDNATAIVTIKTKEGHGSGCIISKDGYVITNYHVVGSAADSLKVVMNNGEEYSATLLRKDPGMDLALIKIEGSNFCSVTPAKSPSCKLGDVIYVIGTPADPSLGQTITKGIFSAQRNVFGKTMYQTDAHVNPGNSGGGMFNDKGELVGIVSSKGSGSVIEGLGFAIPSNYIFERLKIKYQ